MTIQMKQSSAVVPGNPVQPGSAPGPAKPAALSPSEARALFREGLVTPTAGWSAGYAQANLIIVPKAQAFDLLLFAQRNPKPCPILGVLDAGETSGALLAGGDIRTDTPRYAVYENGAMIQQTSRPTGAMTWSRSSWAVASLLRRPCRRTAFGSPT
jgi:uncharacterized protein YcsI (UPF0317 family)